MSHQLTYAELFAGAGGLSMGLEAAGFHAVAHAEIEPHARAVLRKHWPDCRLDGDVTQINGKDYAGITLLSGGSPCQDLSVAGKRAGLGGARSGLFHEQVRLWNESGAPYLLWENVLGALSSNAGKDFAAVLSALVGATIAVPADGWRGGGVAAGREAVAAWRVLDLQHFGPPQRRVRVFVLAARTGGVDPAEVLALSEGVCGHPSPRQQAREGTARSTGTGAAFGIKGSVIGRADDAGSQWSMVKDESMFCLQTHEQHAVFAIGLDGEKNADVELIGTLNTGSKSGSGQQPAVLCYDGMNQKMDDMHHALRTGQDSGECVLMVHSAQITSPQNKSSPSEIAPTLDRDASRVLAFSSQLSAGSVSEGLVPTLSLSEKQGVLSFTPGFVARGEGPRPQMDLVQTLGAYTTGDQAPHVVCTTGEVTHALTHEGADASEDGTGRGTPIVVPSLTASYAKGIGHNKDELVVVSAGEQANAGRGVNMSPTMGTTKASRLLAVDLAPMINTTMIGKHTGNNKSTAMYDAVASNTGRPRRLTPRECERLMSWPDDHTRYGVREDGTEYELSDTARYRACGNGVGSVCVEWIARRLADAIRAQEAA